MRQFIAWAVMAGLFFGAPLSFAQDAHYRGNGTLSVTSSALVNTMTVASSSSPLPNNFSSLTVINVGSNDAAFCTNTSTPGATCTCPENGAATTNGITLPSGAGGYIFNLVNVPASSPTVVSCTGTTILQFQW